MTQFQGNFKYFLDNKEITDINDLPTFYKTVKIDGLNIYFTSVSAPKKEINTSSDITKPFYLDEVIDSLPEYKEAFMEDILNGCYVKVTGDKMFNIETVKKDNLKKAYKETEGKIDYSEINLGILDLMAERMQENKHKYPVGNSKKPMNIKGLEWALFRHLKKMIQPIKNDPETYKQHLSAILCNASMILDQLEIISKENLDNKK